MDINVAKSDSTQNRDKASEPEITLAISLLAFTMFVIVSSEFVVVGLLPAIAKDLNVQLSDIGWVLMGFGLAGVVGNWVSGCVVDRDPMAASAWVAFALAFAMVVVVPVGNSPFGLM